MIRVTQPPVDPRSRDREHHAFWPGLIVALLGCGLLTGGALHATRIEVAEGGTASEAQLVKAFSSGGLLYGSQVQPPPMPKLADPIAESEALDRWQRQFDNFKAPTWKIRVDPNATTPCPT